MHPQALKTQRIAAFFVSVNVVLALALGIFSFLTSLYIWIRLHVHFPAKDILHLLPFVKSVLENGFSSQALTDWLAPHAQAHRIAVTRLAMLIDYQYFGGQNHVIYALSWLSIVALLLVFVTAFRQSYKSEPVLCVFVVGISLIFLSSHTQAFNLVNPINGSWYLALAASAVSMFLITHKPAPPSVLLITAAYFLAALAAYSNFVGVIVWLLLPVLIGFRSLRTGLLAAAISVVFLALYMHGIQSDFNVLKPDLWVAEAELSVAVKVLQFVTYLLIMTAAIIKSTLSYLGAPLSIIHPIWSALLVILSFPVIIAAWLELLKYRFRGTGEYSSWLETTLAIATVTLGAAIATQLGRVIFSAPTAERYQTAVMLYWLCICSLMLYFSLKAKRLKIVWKFVSTTACLAIAALLLLVNSQSMTLAAKLAESANRVSFLGMLGVTDDIGYGNLLPFGPTDFLPGLDAYLMNHKTAYWHDVSRQINFDQSVPCDQLHAGIRPSRWPGISVVTVHIREQWPKLYRQIPVTTARGEVIGFLSPVMEGEVTPLSLYSREEDKWTGYVRNGEIRNDGVYLHYRTSLYSGIACRLLL